MREPPTIRLIDLLAAPLTTSSPYSLTISVPRRNDNSDVNVAGVAVLSPELAAMYKLASTEPRVFSSLL